MSLLTSMLVSLAQPTATVLYSRVITKTLQATLSTNLCDSSRVHCWRQRIVFRTRFALAIPIYFVVAADNLPANDGTY